MHSMLMALLSIKIPNMYSVLIGAGSNVLLLSCMILAICKRFVLEEKEHEITRWKSHRIENEMLKKSIQPHFIMNTLLSIIRLISKNPRKAIRLIQLLADEFKKINQFSAKRMISMEEEMALCRIHLDLMGIRLKNKYQLILENLDLSDPIPPMVFHTLIENGLTHSLKSDEDGTFHISSEKNGNQIRYVYWNSGSKLTEMRERSQKRVCEGLGIRYVKARLEESYGEQWELKYGLKDNHWKVEMVIKS
jgi:LytS/YehU family sensor histidine kinase